MDDVLKEKEYCVRNEKQDFLVSATVYKARHLQVLNCDTFIMVSCDGKYKRTRIAYRTDNPYFNEYFSFSLHCSEERLRRKGIVFSLYRPSICTSMHSCIGEFHVDLNTVWEQENHAFIKKWAMFEPISGVLSNVLNCGYLLIDLTITSSLLMLFPIAIDNEIDYDIIESNRLLPTRDANEEIQRVRYCFSVFQGEFVHSAEYAIRVSYAGLKIRTKTSSFGRSFRWNERLSFIGTYPSTNQIIGIDLLTANCCNSNVKSTKDIHFSSMSKRITNRYNLPTFGPTWLHLYSGIQESHYVGKLLVSFSSEALPIQSVPAHKSQAVRIYEPLLLSNYWEERVFVIKFCIINMQLFAEMSTSQLLVYLSCADICSKAINLNMEKQKPTSRYWFANCAESVLTVKIQLPDYRHKYFVKATITNLCDKLLDFTNLLKRVIIGQGEQNFNLHKHNIFTRLLAQLELSFMQAYDKITEGIYKQHTKLDQLRKSYILQQLILKKSDIIAIKSRLRTSNTFQEVSQFVKEIDSMLNCLLELSNDEQNQYPNILLHVIRSGHSSVIAVARFNMVHYFHQANSLGVTGIQYGKRRTILLRSIHCNHSCPDRCGCIHAKLDYQLQIETERKEQVAPYALIAPEDPLCSDSDGRQELLKNCLTTKYVNCKIHVYQGRIFGGFDDSKQCNVTLSVLFERFELALSTLPCTLPSSWNETVDFKNIPFAISTVACRKMNQECIVMFILQDDKQLTTIQAIGWLHTSVQILQKEDRNAENDNENTEPYGTICNTDLHMLNSVLHWIPLFQRGVRIAEILVSSEIEEICSSSENSGNVEMLLAHGLPPEIVPSLVPFIIKVLFVGLRQMHKRSYQNIKKSRILISIGDGYIMSGDSGTTHGNSANFPEGYETCSVHLPVNPNYWPLMTIKHIDFTNERQMKIIGKSIVNASKLLDSSITKSTPENATIIDIIDQEENETCISNESNTLLKWPNFRYMIEEQVKHFVELKTCAKRLIADNVDHTWWTKFYDGQLSKIHHKYALKIYDTELEKVSDFNGFQDWSGSYTLHKIRDKKKGGKQEYGIVKSLIQIHSNPKASSKQILSVEKPLIPSIVEIVVVVYVVQALNLTSRDIMSQSDAYIKLSYGRQCFRDRAYYIPNQASPVFGRRFEMRGILPRDQILHLSVYDRDFVSSDDLIGSTSIDIEDRFRSKHLPSFGIPNYYKSKGCNKWRHQMKPSEMLQKICENHGLQNPRITGRKIIIGKAEFEAEILEVNECLTEQLCLIALNNFKHVVNGLSLTPEHVETRSLYHPKRGGIEQGKVQVWIELYEPNRPHPLPLDITPQPPKPYELRVIVWNTADVMLNERNIFGTEMSDIYVKCWLQEFTEAQYTDVHYRSLTGEGNFNWRMVFSFRYSPADGMLVLRRRKAFYEQYDTELKYPPVLTVQIWDNDSFSADDFLGTVDLNLTQLPVPASTAEACTLPQSLSTLGSGSGTDGNGTLNLFGCRRIKGWFPVHGNRASNIDTSDRQRWHDGISLTGKIELELEILSQEDASQNPAGVGRKPPQHLPEPLRPEISFNWLRQPAKTFNKLLWPRVRKSFIWIGTVVLMCLIVYGLVINVPTVVMVRSLEQRKSTTSISSGE